MKNNYNKNNSKIIKIVGHTLKYSDNMKCWKSNFTKKPLKDELKLKMRYLMLLMMDIQLKQMLIHLMLN